jgi:hypothetical protein
MHQNMSDYRNIAFRNSSMKLLTSRLPQPNLASGDAFSGLEQAVHLFQVMQGTGLQMRRP